MNTETEENKEILDGINFGDAEEAPDTEPEPAETPQEPGEEAPPAEMGPEEKARAIGWRPKEDWKGDPAKWVDAESYLKKGEELLPIMKADRERLFGEVRDLRKQVSDVLQYHKEDRHRIENRLRAEYDQELADLRAKQRAAVEEGDTEAFDAIELKKEQLEANKPQGPPPGKTGEPPPQFDKRDFDAWKEENKWYQVGGKTGHEPQNDMTKAAQAMSFRVQADNPHLTGWEREFYEKVAEQVKLAYPEKFTNPRRDGAHSGVEGGSGGGSGPRKTKSFSDLPPEAQSECRRMRSAGMTEKQYVSEYFGLEGVSLEG